MTWKRLRLVLSYLAALYLARMYLGMGWVKFDPEGFWTGAFERWGYPVWLRLAVGAAEVGGAILLILPWTASYGAGLLLAVMLGAWVTRLVDGRMVDVAWITLYMAALTWIGWEWWSKRWKPRS